MPMTLEQIRQDGLDALRAKLGQAGMIRFLQQFENGSGDYTAERRKWVDTTSMADLKALTKPKVRKRSRSK